MNREGVVGVQPDAPRIQRHDRLHDGAAGPLVGSRDLAPQRLDRGRQRGLLESCALGRVDGALGDGFPPGEGVPLVLEGVQLAVVLGIGDRVALPSRRQAPDLPLVPGKVLLHLGELARGRVVPPAGEGRGRRQDDAVGAHERVADRHPHGSVHEVGAVVGAALALRAGVARVLRPSAAAPAVHPHAAVAGAAAREVAAEREAGVPLADRDVPSGRERRLRRVPRRFADEGGHWQGVVHTLQLLVNLALEGWVSQNLADEGEVPALSLRRGDALAVQQLRDPDEGRALHAQVVDAPDDRRPFLVDAPALAFPVLQPGRGRTAARLALPQRLDPAVRRFVADIPPLLAAHQPLDCERDPPSEVPRGMDGPRAVHDDELVLLHELHDVGGVVEALLADEPVELGDADLVHGPSADERLDHPHPLQALGQGHFHRGNMGLEDRPGEYGHAGPRCAQALQRDELPLLRLPPLLPGGADATVLYEAGEPGRHHDASPALSSERSVPTRFADSAADAGASFMAGL